MRLFYFILVYILYPILQTFLMTLHNLDISASGMRPSCEEPVVDLWRTKVLVTPVPVQGAVWTLQRTMNIWESPETINWTG